MHVLRQEMNRRRATMACARPLHSKAPDVDPAAMDTLVMDLSPVARKLEDEFAAEASAAVAEPKPPATSCGTAALPASSNDAGKKDATMDDGDPDDVPDIFFAESAMTRMDQMAAKESLQDTSGKTTEDADIQDDDANGNAALMKRPAAKGARGPGRPKGKPKAKPTPKAKGKCKAKAKAKSKAAAMAKSDDKPSDDMDDVLPVQEDPDVAVADGVCKLDDMEPEQKPGEAFGQEPMLKATKPRAKAKAKGQAKAKAKTRAKPKTKANAKSKNHSDEPSEASGDAAEDEEEQDPPSGKATFARRYRPSTDLMASRRWSAIKEAFELLVQPKVYQPSSLEA